MEKNCEKLLNLTIKESNADYYKTQYFNSI